MASEGSNNLLNSNMGIFKKGAHIVLIKTEWNANIVDELERGCITTLQRYNAKVETVIVPGCVEIPFAIKRHWHNALQTLSNPEAYVAMGCVIKGDTPHFDYVCKMVSEGILQLNLILPVPTIFGVLTVNSEHQAKERIGGVHGHKGEEAALTALKMIL